MRHKGQNGQDEDGSPEADGLGNPLAHIDIGPAASLGTADHTRKPHRIFRPGSGQIRHEFVKLIKGIISKNIPTLV
jgi:hypothetical protein